VKLGRLFPNALEWRGRSVRERIRQLENQSLKKLQLLAETQKLRDDGEIPSGFASRMPRHRPWTSSR